MNLQKDILLRLYEYNPGLFDHVCELKDTVIIADSHVIEDVTLLLVKSHYTARPHMYFYMVIAFDPIETCTIWTSEPGWDNSPWGTKDEPIVAQFNDNGLICGTENLTWDKMLDLFNIP